MTCSVFKICLSKMGEGYFHCRGEAGMDVSRDVQMLCSYCPPACANWTSMKNRVSCSQRGAAVLWESSSNNAFQTALCLGPHFFPMVTEL